MLQANIGKWEDVNPCTALGYFELPGTWGEGWGRERTPPPPLMILAVKCPMSTQICMFVDIHVSRKEQDGIIHFFPNMHIFVVIA